MTEPSDDALVCAYFMGAEDYKDKILELQAQNRNLKEAVAEIWWMAQRYADGRNTYAPALYNQMIDLAIKNGFIPNSEDVYAEDGDLGKWIPEFQCFERERIK